MMQTRLKLCSFALIVNTPQSPMQIITANSSYMFDLISSKSTFGLAIANFLTFIHVFTLLNIRFEKKNKILELNRHKNRATRIEGRRRYFINEDAYL